MRKTNINSTLRIEDIMQKIDAVYKNFNKEDLGKLYSMILLSDAAQSVHVIQKKCRTVTSNHYPSTTVNRS
jgi:hypothetical protein